MIRAEKVQNPDKSPVAFFNVSTRLVGISQNAAFATLTSMALQQSQVPVVHFGCQVGLSRCVLGTVVNGAENEPPCETCFGQTMHLTANAPRHWFNYKEESELLTEIEALSVAELAQVTFGAMPLGQICLPALRWTLRRHHLLDDEATQELFRHYILSSWSLAEQTRLFLHEIKPRAMVLFNGIMYPEATVRWVAESRGIPVIKHEVAHQPLSAYFSHGEVTAYPVEIPEAFELDDEQNTRLDEYLSKRFEGEFSMAGVAFWPEMQDLEPAMEAKIAAYSQLVTIFTNVIFDTSQIHANVIFEHMFAWLEQIQGLIESHPETLFVIRAHPDELRPNSRKQSKETVDAWVAASGLLERDNVIYVNPLEYLSSYALIQQAKFVMAYNSTIGLEAALMGKVVLNGGKARYTQYPCVYLPESAEAHREQAETFLVAGDLALPAEFLRQARRFQYYQLWRTPLPFDEFMTASSPRGYVNLKQFPQADVSPLRSKTMEVIVSGILHGKPFLMEE